MDLESVYADYQVDKSFEHLRNQKFRFVPGNGNTDADLFFVGEAPGSNEDRRQQPFVGKSGKILNELLNLINVEREECFVTNVLKYRTDRFNRDPTVPEIQASLPYLANEIQVVNPKIIIALGKIPCLAFLPETAPYKVRGKLIDYSGYKLLVTYHPMAVVHQQWIRSEIEKHFKLIREVSLR